MKFIPLRTLGPKSLFLKVRWFIEEILKSIGFVKLILSGYDDQKRFQLASKLVTEVNHLSWKRPGDKFTTISVPDEIAGKQCFNCVLGGVCLGWNCLEKKSGLFVTDYHKDDVSK